MNQIEIAEQVLQRAGFESLTSMQQAYLEEDSSHSVLLSRTGSGKTFAFLLRLYAQLKQNERPALILCPTRELVQQVFKSWQQIQSEFKSIVCYGGHSFTAEEQQFSANPVVVFGTPGRILDHYTRQTPGIDYFHYWIIDEYDKTLELGFLRELEGIHAYSAESLKGIQLVSATKLDDKPTFLVDFPWKEFSFLENAEPTWELLAVSAVGHDKLATLASLLGKLKGQKTIVFCSHREATERLAQHMNEFGLNSSVYHGGMEQMERERELIKFRHGSNSCLICTDLGARGLDIAGIDAVIHYQYPQTKADFIHRNGRTARMDAEGKVYLLHSENEPLPDYFEETEFSHLELAIEYVDFPISDWQTLYIPLGRKQKIRKVDFAGFFMKDLSIPASEVGSIDVFDNHSYVTISRKAFRKHQEDFKKARIKKVNTRIFTCR